MFIEWIIIPRCPIGREFQLLGLAVFFGLQSIYPALSGFINAEAYKNNILYFFWFKMVYNFAHFFVHILTTKTSVKPKIN